MNITEDLISLIFVLSVMSLFFQIVDNLLMAAVASVALYTTYFFGPSSVIVASKYFKDFTASNLLPLITMSDDKPSLLLAMTFFKYFLIQAIDKFINIINIFKHVHKVYNSIG